MRRIRINLTLIGLLAVAAFAPAQYPAPSNPTPFAASLNRLGGTFVYDPATKKPFLAATYEISRLTGVLGSKVDLSVSGLAGVDDTGPVTGVAGLYVRDIKLRVANELKGVVAVTIGPALLYRTDGGKARLGGVVGLAFRF